jgi:hypothetical protein
MLVRDQCMDAFTTTKSKAGGDLPLDTMKYDFTEANAVVVTGTDEEIEMLQADPAASIRSSPMSNVISCTQRKVGGRALAAGWADSLRYHDGPG